MTELTDRTDDAHRVLMTQSDAMKRGVLPMWTIYDHPKDHPDGFIARRFELDKPTDDTLTGELEELRSIFMRAGLCKLSRQDGDDQPHIVETWV